jgi:hypothetical protein
MAQDNPGRTLTAAQDHLRCACDLLTVASPEALGRSAAVLQSAVASLEAFHGVAARRSAPEMKHAAGVLRSRLRLARALLESAAAYRQDWFGRLGAMVLGYGADRQPARLANAGRWSLLG